MPTQKPPANFGARLFCLGRMRPGNQGLPRTMAKSFFIEHVPIGTYSVFATKEEDGYSALEQIPAQNVVLTADRSFAQLTLKLGPRSGKLSGTAKDKATGKPIGPEGNLTLTYVSVEENSTGSMSGLDGSNLQANLPAGKEFIVFMSAPGYAPWFYVNNQSRPTLRLEPGEEEVLDGELEPKNPQSQLPEAA